MSNFKVTNLALSSSFIYAPTKKGYVNCAAGDYLWLDGTSVTGGNLNGNTHINWINNLTNTKADAATKSY